MRLFLSPNGFTDEQTRHAAECIQTLETDCGQMCALSPGDSLRLFDDESYARFTPEESDLILSLGGDGSVLRAAQIAVDADKPLLGINSGRLGYLCAMDFGEIHRFNECMAECELTQRSLLEISSQGTERYALNDVIIGKRDFGQTVDLDVIVQDRGSFRLRGDGLIVATPTGSTAYSLSAGGPELDEALPAILLTPICNHEGRAHPVAIHERRTVVVHTRNGTAGLYLDGIQAGTLESGNVTVISKASKTLAIYKRRGGSTSGAAGRN